MKILIVSYEYPPQAGGIATYSQAMAHYLCFLGNSVTVLAYTENSDQGEIEKFDEHQKYRIIRFKKYRYKINKIFGRIKQSIRLLKKEKFDIVLFPYSHAAIIGKWIHRKLNIPFVMTCHGAELIQNNIMMAKIIKILFSRADLILANSVYTANLLSHINIPENKIKTVLLGADDQIFDYKKYNLNNIKEKYGFENRRIISTVGSLRRIKGHHIVINALKIIKKKIPDILYLIIGSGPLKKELQELISTLCLRDNVIFIDNVYGVILAEYYALSDIVILNSGEDEIGRRESFGIVLIEANLMGKAVIGTQGSGISSAIENNENGILIPMNNIEATADAVTCLFENPAKMNSLAQKGYERAKRNCTWESVAKKTEFELISLLNSYKKS